MAKTLAVLTGGGHAAGLNAGIAGVIEEARRKGWRVYGALDGWQGVVNDMFVNLTDYDGMSSISKGGSILGTSRVKPTLDKVQESMKKRKVDALIAMGGEDTLGALWNMYSEFKLPSVGWPKTMDNDLSGTYFTIGYPTAIKVASEEVAKFFDAASSPGRVAIVVVFGRHTDWVALGAGAYGRADFVIPAERPCKLDKICHKIGTLFGQRKKSLGKGFVVMVVAEGAQIEGLESHAKEQERELDEYGHVKLDPYLLASYLSSAIKSKTKEMFGKPLGTAPMVLTYQLRNGSPVWVDMELGYKLGIRCVDMLEKQEVGMVAVIKREKDELLTGSAPLEEAIKMRKVEGTGFFDHENLVPTSSFFDYGEPFMGRAKERTINLVDRKFMVS